MSNWWEQPDTYWPRRKASPSIRELSREPGAPAYSTLHKWEKRHEEARITNPRRPDMQPSAGAWGLGGPPLLQPATDNAFEVVVGLFDMHGKHLHEPLMEAALRAIDDLQPDRVVIGGDTWNFDLISRWQKDRFRRMSLFDAYAAVKEEIAEGCANIERVTDHIDPDKVHVVEGNHCDRLRKFMSDDLQEGWDMAYEWLNIEDMGVHYYNRSGFYLRPEFLVKHGDYTTIHTAKKEYMEEQCGGWSGHKHTNGHHGEVFPKLGKRHQWNSVPCMVNLDANYGSGNAGLMRWHQGIVAGMFSTTNPHLYQTDIGLWWDGQLMLRGRTY